MWNRSITALLVALAAATPAQSETTVGIVVNQRTDVLALSAYEMFKFEPQLVRIAAGESVTFMNSMADHTVHSIPQIWPEGAPEVHIDHQPETSFEFAEPGVYGITCARHGQYGMVMLVLVGDPGPEQLDAAADKIGTTRLTPDARKELKSLFEAAVQGE